MFYFIFKSLLKHNYLSFGVSLLRSHCFFYTKRLFYKIIYRLRQHLTEFPIYSVLFLEVYTKNSSNWIKKSTYSHLLTVCSSFSLSFRRRLVSLVHQTGHKGVALTQLCEALWLKTCCGTNCLWCNWGLRPFTRAYIGLYVKMFKEQWISISGCKIVFGTHLCMLTASLNNNKKMAARAPGLVISPWPCWENERD